MAQKIKMIVSNLRNLLDVYNRDFKMRPLTMVMCFYPYTFSFIGTNMESGERWT